MSEVEVRVDRMATGGEAVGRLANGCVIFVQGALAGERLQVRVTDQKKRFARGVVTAVIEASPHRVESSCAHERDGRCGGCDWMFVDAAHQRFHKREIVVEQLRRLGGIDADKLVSICEIEPGLRTTARCKVVDGRAGYRSRRSDAGFASHECGATHPILEELIVDGRYGSAGEITIRVGAVTGERMVVTDGPISEVMVPADVTIVETAQVGQAAIHEQVAGRLWRVSAKSFFQASPAGAQALVTEVRKAVGSSAGRVGDLYAGVGLLGGAATPERLEVAVESNESSVADARHNLGPEVLVEHSRVERWTAVEVDAVIADPARRGLTKSGISVIGHTQATRLVLVSCDPASLGRDVGLLTERDWKYDQGRLINMFPDTSRIEVVSQLSR